MAKRKSKELAIENNLPLAILDGSNIENLRKAICGDVFEGTLVSGRVD